LATSTLEDELVDLAGHLAAAHCRWLRLLAEFDARDGWGGPGLRSCAHWLSWRVGMSLRTATEQVRVARALRGLPAIDSAFAAGRVSYSKVRAITRIATSDTEQTLLDLALAGTASHVERVVRLTRQARADPTTRHAERCVSWHWDDEGCLVLRGRLPAEQGARLVAAITALLEDPAPEGRRTPPRERSAERERTPPKHPPAGTSGDATTAMPSPIVPLAARRADALTALVTGGASCPPAQVVVHVDADKATAEIQNGPAIAPATAERLSCAARAQVLLADRRGNPLYLGRSRRLVSKTLLAALGVRDHHHCQFPGCTNRRWLQAHHVRHWWHGGRTDIDNLVLICEVHHRLIHDHGYRVTGAGRRLHFHRPDGRPIPREGAETSGHAATLIELNEREGLPTSAEALTPTWAGEPLDPTPILLRLLPATSTTAA
jgi:hypothetical protein